MTPGEAQSASALRRFVLVVLTIGMFGVLADLIALKHFEDSWQLVPLLLIGLALGAIVWYLAGGGAASVRLLQVLMLFFVVAGALGVVLHYRGNMEFQLEMDPTLSGMALAAKVLRAKAPPTLAPGVMAQLGLLGLVYTYRHPAVRSRRPPRSPEGA